MEIIVWPSLYESTSGWGISIPVASGGTSVTPTTNATTYIVKVDWDGDGDFSEASENISANVREIIFDRGIEKETGISVVGQLQLRLNNATGTYTPTLHTATVLPKRLVQVSTETGGAYTLYTGYLEDITPHPHLTQQDCYITALDGMDYLARAKVNHGLSTNYIDTVITNILDAASWPNYARVIDGATITLSAVDYNLRMSLFYLANADARPALEKLGRTALGRCYIDRNGYFNFENYNHRTTNHATSQFTFTDTMVDITEDINTRDIYNEIRVPYEISTYSYESEIYTFDNLNDKWLVPAGQTLTKFVDYKRMAAIYSELAESYLSDTELSTSEDYTYSHVNYGSYGIWTVINNEAHDIYFRINFDAYVYSTNSYQEISSNDDSQDAYQLRSYEHDAYSLYNAHLSEGVIQKAIADTLLADWKDPHPNITMTVINKNATLLNQILTLGISDRITVVNTKLGIDADYYIDYMEHEIIEGGMKHTVTYRLSPA